MKRWIHEILYEEGQRRIYDPLKQVGFILSSKNNMISVRRGDQLEAEPVLMTKSVNEIFFFFRSVYERFRSDMNTYLSKVSEGETWCFVDITHGMEIQVVSKRTEDGNPEWVVLIGEDPSLITCNRDEVYGYIKGLLFEKKPFW